MRYVKVAPFTAWLVVVVMCVVVTVAALLAARADASPSTPPVAVGVLQPDRTQQQVFAVRTVLAELPGQLAQGVDVRPWAQSMAAAAYAAADQRVTAGALPADPLVAGYRSLGDAASRLSMVDPATDYPLVLGAARQVLSAGDALVALATVDTPALATGSLEMLLNPTAPVAPEPELSPAPSPSVPAPPARPLPSPTRR